VVQWRTPQDWLEKELGKKKGQMLWNFARGVDDRSFQPLHVRWCLFVRETVPCVCTSRACPAQTRKSIGTQLSWGVRFTEKEQVPNCLFTPHTTTTWSRSNDGVVVVIAS
jgi:nucleotidyltransferase/DNA polymerase involved in DNA repair